MSQVPGGPGWWQGPDALWYPPQGAATGRPQGGGPGRIPVPARSDGLATAALVLAISGTVLLCACGIGVIGTIAAIPMGLTARSRIRASGGTLTGDGVALAAVVIGSIATALAVVVLLVALAGTGGSGSGSGGY